MIVRTSDNKIWNKTTFISDLFHEVCITKNNSNILIDLNLEGPCCKESGIDKVIDNVLNKFDIDPKRLKMLIMQF